MIDPKITRSFYFTETGKTTKRPYNGEFEVKLYLTQRELFEKDKIRRDLVGNDPTAAAQSVHEDALMISEIRIRCTKVPDWFSESRFGLELYDHEIVPLIYDKLVSTIDAYFEDLKKSTLEPAKEQLAANKESLSKPL